MNNDRILWIFLIIFSIVLFILLRLKPTWYYFDPLFIPFIHIFLHGRKDCSLPPHGLPGDLSWMCISRVDVFPWGCYLLFQPDRSKCRILHHELRFHLRGVYPPAHDKESIGGMDRNVELLPPERVQDISRGEYEKSGNLSPCMITTVVGDAFSIPFSCHPARWKTRKHYRISERS